MDPGPPAWPAPRARPRVAWGLPDVGVTWLVGILASLVAVAPFVSGDSIPRRSEAAAAVAALFVQDLAIVGWLGALSRRKGMARMASDFGLVLRRRDLWWLVIGVLVWLGTVAVVAPITELADTEQEVVRTFERAGGPEVPFFVLGVVVLAPLAEELLFRGALLRALLRRTTPPTAIFVSALLFALIHVAGGLGSGPVVPGLVLLGLLSAWQAVRTGSLSRSILLHAGFNLIAAVLIVA